MTTTILREELAPTRGEQHDLQLLLGSNSAFRKTVEHLKQRVVQKWMAEATTAAEREVSWIQIQCIDDLMTELVYMRDCNKVDDARLSRQATLRKGKDPLLDV